MKFRKYSGELRNHTIYIIFFFVLFPPLSILLSIRSGDYRLLFFLGLLPIVYIVTSSWFFIVHMLHDDKAHISDMIVIDEEGIKLECEDGKNTVILWEDIIKIERRNNFNMSRSMHVMSKSGEEIWWYSANEKAKKYILEQHPELEKRYAAKKGYY